MAPKILKQYLIRIVPFFVLTFLAWRLLGLSKFYHILVALPLDLLNPRFDPTGFVQGAFVEGEEFVFRILCGGKHMELRIIADDLTSNTVLLVALFLSSPIRSVQKLYLTHFAAALVILYSIHVFSVAAGIQFAFMTNPEILANDAMDQPTTRLFAHYARFYEFMGMYLFVLVLWSPYVVRYLAHVRRRADD